MALERSPREWRLPMTAGVLERLFANTPEADRRKITSENAAKLFGFALS